MSNHRLNILIVLLLALVALPSFGSAISKRGADDNYRQGNYQQAIADYQALLRQGASAKVYFNLGNAYYRSDSLSKAILCYERAYRLSPSDDDVRFNLQFARSKTIDKIAPQDDNFFTTVYRSIVTFCGVDSWALIGIVSIVMALLLMLAYLFASLLWMRKLGFFGSLAFLVVFVLSTVFAWQQKYWFEHSRGAIVMSSSIGVKQEPEDRAPDAFVLHEGTHVNIEDDGISGWKQVRTGDGREGWIKSGAIENI